MNFKQCFCCAVFFGVLYIFAANSCAQSNLETYTQIIERGNTEQKRDALLQIRNLENAEASRIAVPLLRDSSEIVRATAAFSVVFLPKEEASQILLPLLKDKSALVRRETAYALGKIQNPAAVTSLLQTFQKDKISEVKNACIVALGEIGDVSAIDALVKILQNKRQNKDEFTRRSAARSIGQIAQIIQTGNAQVLAPENLPSGKSNPIEKPKYPKLTESFPVFRIAISILIRSLQDSREFPDVKRQAAFALGAIGDDSAISVLQSNLGSEDYHLAEISRQSLMKISSRSNQKDGINSGSDGIKF